MENLNVIQGMPSVVQGTPQQQGSEDQDTDGSQSQEEEWRMAVLDEIRGKITEPRLGAEELASLVEDLQAKRISLYQGGERVEQLANKYFPDIWKSTAPREGAGQKPCSNKMLRRKRYAHIQRLFRNRRKDAASTILDGRWRDAHVGPTRRVEGLEDFWVKILQQGSEGEEELKIKSGGTKWAVLAPIVAEEVTAALRGLRRSAVGVDKITAKDLLTWHQPSLAGFFNILMVVEGLPSTLAIARVTLIPKTDVPKTPNDYRPIAITSVLTRAFH